MNNTTYIFDPESAFRTIEMHWKNWANSTHTNKWIVAVSGGKDSTVVAWMAARIFGADNVTGLMLPCDGQKDIEDSHQVINTLGIHDATIDIGDAVVSIRNGVENNAIEVSDDTKINLPPRIRMAATYAVAQSLGAVVLNTSNITEDILGYATLWGDSCGSYAPIQGLTVTEVIKLGEYLGIPDNLIHKTPADGLQDLSDEDKLGMKYADVDILIRENREVHPGLRDKVLTKFFANKFKIDMIHLSGPKFMNLPNSIFNVRKCYNVTCSDKDGNNYVVGVLANSEQNAIDAAISSMKSGRHIDAEFVSIEETEGI